MNKITMLYFDRIKVFEGTDVNKTSASKVSIICYNCYYLDREFKGLTGCLQKIS